MTTKSKSEAKRFLESVRGGPLTFGRMLESIRKADGLSQAELARKLRISRAHLCDIEKGRRKITPERAVRFADILGYSVRQFVALVLEDELRDAGLNLKVQLEAA
ncbi:MAG: helix-turn-helix transcriptional regulator [Pseudomonadota bacterium]